jgi:hypothetical protein
VSLKHIEHVPIHRILLTTGILEGSVFEAVVFEHALLFLGNTKGGQNSLVFKFEGGFASAVLDNTKYLEVEERVFNDAAI